MTQSHDLIGFRHYLWYAMSKPIVKAFLVFNLMDYLETEYAFAHWPNTYELNRLVAWMVLTPFGAIVKLVFVPCAILGGCFLVFGVDSKLARIVLFVITGILMFVNVSNLGQIILVTAGILR